MTNQNLPNECYTEHDDREKEHAIEMRNEEKNLGALSDGSYFLTPTAPAPEGDADLSSVVCYRQTLTGSRETLAGKHLTGS